MAWIKRSKDITDQRNWYPADKSLQNILGGSGNRADTGERVTKQSVLSQPSWYAAVRLRANTLAKVPKPIYLPTDAGREKQKEHRVYSLLNGMANPFTSSFDFFHALAADHTYGNGYGIIRRDEDYQPESLHNVDARDVDLAYEYEGPYLTSVYYVVRSNGQVMLVPSQDVIHVKDLAIGYGTQGVNVITEMRNNFSLGAMMTKYASVYFKNGSHVSKVIKVPTWLSEDQKEQLREGVSDLHEGIDKAHKTLYLMGGADISTLPASNEAAQFHELQRQSNRDKAVISGVPGNKVGEKEGLSQYGNLAEENDAWLSDFVDPFFCMIEAELEAKLFSTEERASGLYIEFERKAVFRGNPEKEDALLEKQWVTGRISWEEWRAKTNQSTKRSGTYVLPSNVAPWEAPDSQHPQPPEPPPPPAPAPVDQPADQPADQPPADQPPADQPEDKQAFSRSADVVERSVKLTENVLERLKRRFVKAKGIDLDIVAEALEGIEPTAVVDELAAIKDELDSVLPEQREGIIELWDTKSAAQRMWI